MEKDALFWEWLRNRDKVAEQPAEQPRLELPIFQAPPRNRDEAENGSQRGVVIIDL